MEILLAPWLPPCLLVLGICCLLQKGMAPKVVGAVLVFVGGLFTVAEIWMHVKRKRC
jgi:hypothetical protein